jgi:hypothetical protein
MTEISVTESLDGLLLPQFTHDRIIRNDKGQVIRREFYLALGGPAILDETNAAQVGVLTQDFDRDGYLVLRHFTTENPDPRLAAREEARLRRDIDRTRFR